MVITCISTLNCVGPQFGNKKTGDGNGCTRKNWPKGFDACEVVFYTCAHKDRSLKGHGNTFLALEDVTYGSREQFKGNSASFKQYIVFFKQLKRKISQLFWTANNISLQNCFCPSLWRLVAS